MSLSDYVNKSVRNEISGDDFMNMIEGLLHPSIIVYVGDLTTAEVMLSKDDIRDDLITYLGLEQVAKPFVYDLIWKISVVLHKKPMLDMYNAINAAAKESNDPAYIFEMSIGMKYPYLGISQEMKDVNPSKAIDISKAIKFNQTNKGAGYYEGNFGPYELISYYINNGNEAVALMLNMNRETIVDLNQIYGFFHEASEYTVESMYAEAMDYHFRGSFTESRLVVLEQIKQAGTSIAPDMLKSLYNNELAFYLGMDFFTSDTLMKTFKAYSVGYINPGNVSDHMEYSWSIPSVDKSIKIGEEQEIYYNYGNKVHSYLISIRDVLVQILESSKGYIQINIPGQNLPDNYWSGERIFQLFELVETDKRFKTKERNDILKVLTTYHHNGADSISLSTLSNLEKNVLRNIFLTFHQAYDLYHSDGENEKDNIEDIIPQSITFGNRLKRQLDQIKGSRLKLIMLGTFYIDNLYTFLRTLSLGLIDPEEDDKNPYDILGDNINTIHGYGQLIIQ
jgi:hypothetical protein